MNFQLREGVCFLQCHEGHNHGKVILKEIIPDGPTKFIVQIDDIKPGLHGFHIHRSGNTTCGPDSLCDHYNPENKRHGNLNEYYSHMGDLGNVFADARGRVRTKIIANKVRLRGPYSVFGRSLIVHEDPDDLGLGNFPDSLTTGHSGKRILWGIIAVNDDPCLNECS